MKIEWKHLELAFIVAINVFHLLVYHLLGRDTAEEVGVRLTLVVEFTWATGALLLVLLITWRDPFFTGIPSVSS